MGNMNCRPSARSCLVQVSDVVTNRSFVNVPAREGFYVPDPCESTVDVECSPPVPCCPMVLCQLLGIIIRICSKRFLPDKSSINVVERRSVHQVLPHVNAIFLLALTC